MANYTYIDFLEEIIQLTDISENITTETADRIKTKARALKKALENKANYNSKNPRKAKGASPETLAIRDKILAILPNNENEAMTSARIADTLKMPLTPLSIATATKFIPNIAKTKVVDTYINSKGLKSERQYTAYYLIEQNGEKTI